MAQKKGIRILVVDDEPGMRDFLCYELTDAGYDVFTACDGLEAMAHFEKQPFPLIITDIMMPKMDGLQLLSRIKQIDPGVEVIMATGFGVVEHAVKAMKNGAFDFIQKPYTIQEMMGAVDKALEKSRQQKPGKPST